MTTDAHQHQQRREVNAMYIQLSVEELRQMVAIIDCVPSLCDRFHEVRQLRGKLCEAEYLAAQSANA